MISGRQFATAVLLVAVFAVSVVIRLPNLRGPISHRHELFLTAIVLREIEIWQEIGLVKAHYAPMMTYPGAANRYINNEEAIQLQMDAKGNFYYTSYPPFSLYFLYAVFGTIRTHPTVGWLRAINVFLHFLSSAFIYLTVRQFLRDADKRGMRAAALFGFVAYVFFPETLWAQSSLYFCDIFAQVFFAAALYLVAQRIASAGRPSMLWLISFTVFLFLFSYTDWLGVMFGAGLFAFCSIYQQDLRLSGIRVAVMAGTITAVGLTMIQYSRIGGLDDFVQFAAHKYLYRSGLGHSASVQIHVWSWLGGAKVLVHYLMGYFPALVIIFVCLLITIEKPAPLNTQVKYAIVICAVLPVLLHHVAFLNFTVIHDFSVLKGAVPVAILVGVLARGIFPSERPKEGTTATLSLAFIALSLSAFLGFEGYQRILGSGDNGYKSIGEIIASNSAPGEVVFVEYTKRFLSEHPDAAEEPYPAIVLYAHRNVARWVDEAQGERLANLNCVSHGVVFTISDAGDTVARIRHITFPSEP